MKSVLEKNKEYSEKYIQPWGEMEIPKNITELILSKKIKNIVDLGCGDGYLIRAVKKKFQFIKITGVDISPRRINRLKSEFKGEDFYCVDCCNTKIQKKFDLVYSSQVIEHVEDDKRMVKEILRLVAPKGYIYVSSVIRKPFGVYKYRNNGRFVLDPTEKEYKDAKEFMDLFKGHFQLINYKVSPVKRNFLFLKIRIPRFYLIEGIWQRKG